MYPMTPWPDDAITRTACVVRDTPLYEGLVTSFFISHALYWGFCEFGKLLWSVWDWIPNDPMTQWRHDSHAVRVRIWCEWLLSISISRALWGFREFRKLLWSVWDLIPNDPMTQWRHDSQSVCSSWHSALRVIGIEYIHCMYSMGVSRILHESCEMSGSWYDLAVGYVYLNTSS